MVAAQRSRTQSPRAGRGGQGNEDSLKYCCSVKASDYVGVRQYIYLDKVMSYNNLCTVTGMLDSQVRGRSFMRNHGSPLERRLICFVDSFEGWESGHTTLGHFKVSKSDR